VRGYRWQGVGPQYGHTKYAIGGTSLDAGTVEYRQRLFKSFGLAAFADAGQVGSNSMPFTGTLRVGAGGGVRYYTPIGPVRLDVAVPLNRAPRGDSWDLYIGLGETF
jgi:translocation and assembly module TamA